jgi:peptidyl-tRNA hydrolase, PTH1 family
MDYLIVGLGNPGQEYELTRHNVAWDCLDKYSCLSNCSWKSKFKGLYTSFEYSGGKIYVLKPQTYMNLSGESVQAMMRFFKVPLSNILVLHDDIDLDFGLIVFKKGGGLAGHNGLKSINNLCGGPNFMRLRLGVGRPKHGSVSSWVLSKFSGDDLILLDHYFVLVSNALDEFVSKGFERASNKYSRKKVEEL